jgi:hypothetical protein
MNAVEVRASSLNIISKWATVSVQHKVRYPSHGTLTPIIRYREFPGRQGACEIVDHFCAFLAMR